MSRVSESLLYSNGEYEIRPARNFDEFREMWWGFMQNLGWNRGYYDLETYMRPSIGYGMILLIEKATQRPVGHVSAVINSNSTGWVSMFIIDEAHRGKGMGGELFKAAMADFERNGTKFKGLDGVPQQKATYERRGFVDSRLGSIRIMDRSLAAREPLPTPAHKGHIVDLRSISKKLLVQHELKFTGFERPNLWNDENIFNRPDVLGVALVGRIDPQTIEDIHGWAVIRRCSQGVRVGPLYAIDTPSAEAVLISVTNLGTPEYIKSIRFPNEPMNAWSNQQVIDQASITVEVWGGNPEACTLFRTHGWKEAASGDSSVYRMWVNDQATPQQSDGGLAQTGVFAVFDAAVG